jgi:ribosomal protein L11 methyltransferase
LTGTDWLEVRLQGNEAQLARTHLILQQLAFPGWVEEDCSDGFSYLLYVPQEGSWQERLQILESSLAEWGVQAARLSQVKDEDWAENWKRFYHPLKVGPKLVICPSWEEYQPAAGEQVIALDPGSAFGTGYHWSTRLCMEFLEELEEQGKLAEPMLDLGTGSGILAIAAARLGQQQILAIDNDPVAVKVAQENVAINGLQIPVQCADSAPEGNYALITANLIAALLVEMAPSLKAALAPGGHLICGGIIDGRRDEVVEAMSAVGLRLVAEKAREEWVSLWLTRP